MKKLLLGAALACVLGAPAFAAGPQIDVQRIDQDIKVLSSDAFEGRGPGQPGFSAGNGQSLLDAAEQSGLKPAFGCRRGICMSCQCRKTSGIVRNQLTQTDSSDSEEWIQLCISTPLSDVHLEL